MVVFKIVAFCCSLVVFGHSSPLPAPPQNSEDALPEVDFQNGLITTTVEDVVLFDSYEEITFPLPKHPTVRKISGFHCDAARYKLCHELRKVRDIVEATHGHQLRLEAELLYNQIYLWKVVTDDDEFPAVSSISIPKPRKTLCTKVDCNLKVEDALKESRKIMDKFDDLWDVKLTRINLTRGAQSDSLDLDYLSEERQLVYSILVAQLEDLHHQIKFHDLYTEYTRALTSCQNLETEEGYSIVHSSTLQARLVGVNEELSKRNLELAIPPSQTDQYYGHPLARCKFQRDDGDLTLRLPVKTKGSSYRLRNIVVAPYAGGRNKSCRINIISEKVVVDEASKEAIILEDGYLDKCLRAKLCKVPELTPNPDLRKEARCISELIRGDGGILSLWSLPPTETSCSVVCTKADKHERQKFTEIYKNLREKYWRT